MSTFNDIDISCQQCGEDFRGTIWTAIHARQDPELKDLLLGGELNLVMCPECSYVAYQDHFLLYQDPAAELIAYIYPLSQQSDAENLRVMVMKSFKEAQEVYEPKDRFSYEPVLLFGLGSVGEMLREEENRAEQSQVAQELCKFHTIPIHLLRPSAARKRGTMRAIPYFPAGKEHDRTAILKGLDRLLEVNPALTLYADLQKKIMADPEWSLKSDN